MCVCLCVCVCVCVCVCTGHRDRQQLEDPEVEPDLNQYDGPDQENKVDIAGFLGAFLSLEEASW